jgi:hypothetical protein
MPSFKIFFFVVLEFELRTSHLRDMHSTTWATPAAQNVQLYGPFSENNTAVFLTIVAGIH